MQNKISHELLKENRALVELPKVPFFKNAADFFLREVAALLENHAFLPGEYIIRQGEIGDCMYFITDGTVEVLVNDHQVAVIGSGGLFGEMALVYCEPRNASIRTLEHCGTYRLSKQNFDMLRTKYRHFDHAVRNIAHHRLISSQNSNEEKAQNETLPFLSKAS